MFLKPKSKLSRLPGVLIDCNWKDKLLIFLKKCHLLSGPVLGFSLDFSKCLMSFHTPRPEFWSAPNTVNKNSPSESYIQPKTSSAFQGTARAQPSNQTWICSMKSHGCFQALTSGHGPHELLCGYTAALPFYFHIQHYKMLPSPSLRLPTHYHAV